MVLEFVGISQTQTPLILNNKIRGAPHARLYQGNPP
jgi:hypothetical protein